MPHYRVNPLNRTPADVDEDFAPAGYTLVFEEDFTSFVKTSTGLNSGVPCWRTTFADGGRFHSTEEQIYTDSAYLGLGLDPFEVSGSPATLKIKMTKLTAPQQDAMPNNPNTAAKPKYWSGVLTSANLSLALYGYWVIRMKAPVGPADQWPTFWLFPHKVPYTTPDPYEELDIMEATHDTTSAVYTVLHYPTLAEITIGYPRVTTTDWNVYSALRTPEGVEFRVNGVPTCRATMSPTYYLYMLLNYAARAGGLSNEGILPNYTEVAWIRYYAPPAAAYTANPVNFDGTNDYLLRTGGLLNSADSKQWTGSLWFRRGGGNGVDQRIISDSSGRYGVQLFTDNTVRLFATNSSFVQILLATVTTAITDTSWHHLMWSLDMASTSSRWVYLDGVATTPTWTTYTDAAIDWTGGNQGIGASSAGTAKFNGDMAEFQMWTGVLTDLTVAGNRDVFLATNAPADPALAEAALGVPAMRFVGPTIHWHLNAGNGGTPAENGELTDGTGPVEF